MSDAKSFAVIDAAGVVNNVIVAEDGFAIEGMLLVASDTAGVGDLYDAGTSEFTRPPAPEPELSAADYQNAIVAMLDAAAQARRYDNAVSISTYVASTVPSWSAEASAFVAWRDAVWGYAYAELDKVQQGNRPQPTVADFLAELPEIVW